MGKTELSHLTKTPYLLTSFLATTFRKGREQNPRDSGSPTSTQDRDDLNWELLWMSIGLNRRFSRAQARPLTWQLSPPVRCSQMLEPGAKSAVDATCAFAQSISTLPPRLPAASVGLWYSTSSTTWATWNTLIRIHAMNTCGDEG